MLVASCSVRSLEENPLLVLGSKCSRCSWLVRKGMMLREGRMLCEGMMQRQGDSAVREDDAVH
jgi:hypothetical protein